MKQFKTFFLFLIDKQKVNFSFYILINCFLALFKSASIWMLIPLLENYTTFKIRTNFYLFDNLLDKLMKEFSLNYFLLFFLVLLILQTILKVIQHKFSVSLIENFVLEEKTKFIKQIQNVDWIFFKKQKYADYYYAFLNQIDHLGNSLFHFSNLMEAFFLLLFYSLSLIILLGSFSVFVFIALLPLLFFQLYYYFRAKKIGQNENQLTSNQIEIYNEQLYHLREIKLSAQKDVFFNQFKILLKKIRSVNKESNKLQQYGILFYDLLIFISFWFMLKFSTFFVTISVAKFGIVFLFLLRLGPHINRFLLALTSIRNSVPFFESYTVTCFNLKNNQTTESENISESKFDLFSLKIEQLNFSYPENKVLFNNFTCEFKANKINALVGYSGNGKTTLLEIIIGLITSYKGEIYCDETLLNINNYASFQSKLSYVPQKVDFLNATILENLNFLQEKYDSIYLQEILTNCKAFDFIKSLPNGLHTTIGENAWQLSGGERQRIAILKALLKKPKLLILDEATNSIDEENENAIFEFLKEKSKEMTIIFVSHRSYLKKYADNVVCI